MIKIALILFFSFQTSNMVHSPLVITYHSVPFTTIPREELGLIPIEGAAFPDTEKITKLEKMLENEVRIEPRDAFIGKNGTIISGEQGQLLDKERFAGKIMSYFFKGRPTSIELPVKVVYPKVDSELLDSIRGMAIGRYTTFFNSGNKERSHNIALAVDTLNNKVVFPGETFSFNKSVGKRTADKGYLKAPIIVRGELSEGIGGGICQVSSTLFNAVDNAGMKIGKRYSHTKSVTYVPPGRDATVSWYGPDFTFTNTYSQPVLIRAKSLGSQLSVTIYSSQYIDFKPRSIPGAPALLPKETPFLLQNETPLKKTEKQPQT